MSWADVLTQVLIYREARLGIQIAVGWGLMVSLAYCSQLALLFCLVLEMGCSGNRHLNTLRPRKMAAIFQTTFSNAFSSMEMYEFHLRFHWSLFLGVQLTIFHYLIQWWLAYWHIYASLGLNELNTNPFTLWFPSHSDVTWAACHLKSLTTLFNSLRPSDTYMHW